MSDNYYGESTGRITGDRYTRAVRKLFYFYCQQQDVPPADRFSALSSLEAIIDKVDDGEKWLSVSEEALIIGADQRWRQERESARLKDKQAARGRYEILRGLRDL